MTNNIDAKAKGWVLYDGGCGMCRRGIRTLGGLLRRLGYRAAPLQEPWVHEAVGKGTGRDEVLVLTADGKVRGGVEAYLHVANEVWWGKPLAWVGRIPWVKAA